MRSKLFMGALLGAAIAMGGLSQQALPAPVTVQAQSRRRVMGGFGRRAALIGTRYSRRTVAMDKRAAAKRRNQVRSKGRAR